MTDYSFPSLPLESWQATLDTLQSYAKFIGKFQVGLSSINFQLSDEHYVGLIDIPI